MEIYSLSLENRDEERGTRRHANPWGLVVFTLLSSLFSRPSSLYSAVADGYVVKVESSTVYLDWGKASGVAVGDQFKIYREGAALKHPVTGEVLGHEQQEVGQGLVEHIEDKFSNGKILQNQGGVKAGDRTQRLEPAAPAALSIPTPAPASGASVPKEVYRGEPMKQEAVGLALGDIDGDGKPELVLAYRDQIEVFKSDGQKPVSFAIFKTRGIGNFIGVDTADVEGAGHDKIFASYFIEGVKRARTVVLELMDGKLKEVGRFSGFARALTHADGKRVLLVQDLSMSRELRVHQPALVVKKDKDYTEGPIVKLPRALNNDQMFGYAWGDWDGDGSEDFAFLQNGERLRLFFTGNTWSSDDAYGGTKADFSWEDEQIGSLYPRLWNVKVAGGKDQLLVSHNIQFMPIRLARLKIYKESELFDLAWNGLEMRPNWRIPVQGALADFGVGDFLGRGAPQIWIAASNRGDQTILLAYSLP